MTLAGRRLVRMSTASSTISSSTSPAGLISLDVDGSLSRETADVFVHARFDEAAQQGGCDQYLGGEGEGSRPEASQSA